MHVNVWIQQTKNVKGLQKSFAFLALQSWLENSVRKASSAAFLVL